MDYYFTLDTGEVLRFTNVVATPTLVDNDGVATKVKSGFYRDYVGAAPNSAALTNAWGPGYIAQTTFTGTTASTYAYAYGDNVEHEPPRQLEWAESHWKVECDDPDNPGTTFEYFVPWKNVTSMSPTNPSL